MSGLPGNPRRPVRLVRPGDSGRPAITANVPKAPERRRFSASKTVPTTGANTRDMGHATMRVTTTYSLLTMLIAAAAPIAGAQIAGEKKPVTDSEKIADALRAGPDFVTKDATIIDWPSTKGGTYRVLRQG